MANGWQPVSMGTFLTHRKEFFTIDDFSRYKRARVQLHGKGIVVRDEVNGAEVKTKQQQAARTGEFLVAEIDAKVGGFGIVPSELDGVIVSSHYFLFEIDENKCLRQWLDWYIRSGLLEDQVTARGSTNYSAIRPNHVLNFCVPLPPLREQRRIVARIEALAERITAAQALRKEASEEGEVIVQVARNDIVAKLSRTCPMFSLQDLCTKITDGPHVSPDYVSKTEGVAFISVRNISETGLDFSTAQYVSRQDHEEFSKRVNVERGDVLFTKVGSTGTARRIDTDTEFSIWVNLALLKPKRDVIIDAFMEHMINAPFAREQTSSMTAGSSTQYIGLGKIGKIKIPVPPLEEQTRIVTYLDGLQAKVTALRAAQAETERELNALMPSILDQAFKGES